MTEMLLTYTLTHTGKRADGDNGCKSTGKDSTSGGREHKSARKQQTPSSQSVGKDEVGSSNLPSSSIKTLTSNDVSVFIAVETT